MNYNLPLKQIVSEYKAPEELDIPEMFKTLQDTVYNGIGEEKLDFLMIIRLISDLRENLNPARDPNIYFITDVICDKILSLHEGIDKRQLPSLFSFIAKYQTKLINNQ